jgi:hypothetical protein
VAILMSLVYITLFTMLMMSMLSVVLGQVKPTAQARKDVGSVNAASSGLQAGIAVLRAAKDADGKGDRGRLPCSAGNVTTFRSGTASEQTHGTVLTADSATVPGAFRYEAHLAYFLQDPTDQPPSWLERNSMQCPLRQTPFFAYLQSYGPGPTWRAPAAARATAATARRPPSTGSPCPAPTSRVGGSASTSSRPASSRSDAAAG